MDKDEEGLSAREKNGCPAAWIKTVGVCEPLRSSQTPDSSVDNPAGGYNLCQAEAVWGAASRSSIRMGSDRTRIPVA